MRRILKLLCLFSLFLLAVTPSWAENLQQAPLNLAFLEYLQHPLKTSENTTILLHTGRTPSPVDLSHLAGKSLLPAGKMAASSTFPENYDLRDEGFVSPVRNQNPYGTCWTFAAMASMESTAMKLLDAESADLAEWDLAYYGYVDESQELVAFEDYEATDFNPGTGDPRDWSVNSGGDDFKAAAILSRWTGPAWETDLPYCGNAPDGTEADAYHLSDVMFLYYDRDTRYAPVSIENVKYTLMNYGAVSVGVYADSGWSDEENPTPYFNLVTSAAYIPQDNTDDLEVGSANHAVNIVGWDDNYSRENFAIRPDNDGAWIVRNSWGTNWGDEGYFYLSYEDAVLDTGAAYVSAPADNYGHIYQYDPLGLCSMYGLDSETAWMANTFVAEGIQALGAISFYASTVDTEYEISVFTDVDGNPTDGSLALHAQTGILHMPGYRTVELDDPVLLSAGQTFSVVVKLTTPGYNYPIAIEYAMTNPYYNYSGKASAHPGESYISSDGLAWTDTTIQNATANVCLKAFTNDIKLMANQGETLPPLGSETSTDAAFDDFLDDLEEISGDILAFLDEDTLPGTLGIIGQGPVEFRCGDVPAPLTVSFEQVLSRNGRVIESVLLLAYNHETGRYEIPSETGDFKTRAISATTGTTFSDGGPYDNKRDPDGILSDLRLMEVLVQAEVEETPMGGGGGCSLGTLAPASLLLLVPLALLKKRK